MQGQFRFLKAGIMICIVGAILAAGVIPAAAETDTGSLPAGVVNNTTAGFPPGTPPSRQGDLNATGNATAGGPGANTSILPGNPLYGLKLTFEKMDESFTFNSSDRLAKQLYHADNRLSEAESAFLQNNTADAERALSGYYDDTNATAATLAGLPPGAPGLRDAERTMETHQQVLGQLITAHPNSTGLQEAFRNNAAIQEWVREQVTRDNETRGRITNNGEAEGTFSIPAGQPGQNLTQDWNIRNPSQVQVNQTSSQQPEIQKTGTGRGNTSANGISNSPGREISGNDTGTSENPAGQIRSPPQNQSPSQGQNPRGAGQDDASGKSTQNQNTGKKQGNGR
ncbi:MAG: DUF5667 domain-containing protein [Methanoregulaceae archaeon]